MSIISNMTREDIDALAKDSEKAKITADALKMEHWLEVKSLLESDEEDIRVLRSVMDFAEMLIITISHADAKKIECVLNIWVSGLVNKAREFKKFLREEGLE